MNWTCQSLSHLISLSNSQSSNAVLVSCFAFYLLPSTVLHAVHLYTVIHGSEKVMMGVDYHDKLSLSK